MNTLKPLSLEEANTSSQAIFKSIKSNVGMLPNLYAAMGVSDKLLGGFLSFTETLKSGEFSKKEYEAIALATSQANGCAYCLSAHTTLGKMNGFTDKETIELRNNSSLDIQLNALVTLANEFVVLKGRPTAEVVTNFFEVGFNKTAFAELVAIVSMITITNTIYHNGGFDIDFPKAQNLEELVQVQEA